MHESRDRGSEETRQRRGQGKVNEEWERADLFFPASLRLGKPSKTIKGPGRDGKERMKQRHEQNQRMESILRRFGSVRRYPFGPLGNCFNTRSTRKTRTQRALALSRSVRVRRRVSLTRPHTQYTHVD